MTHVYIAGRYSRRDEFREMRKKLYAAGYIVNSRWLNESSPLDSQMGDQEEEFYLKTQRVDLVDICRAEEMLFFAEDPTVGVPRGGRHVEFGYALASGIPINVIGPRENVFHYHHTINHYATLEDFLAANRR